MHFGKPLMIHEKDCDMEELQLADLDGEVDYAQALSLLEHVKLARLGSLAQPHPLQLARRPADGAETAGGIMDCEFSPGAARSLPERMAMRERCHVQLSEWQQSLPPELVYKPHSTELNAVCLQLAFLTQLLLLNRPVIYTDRALPEAVRLPAEAIAGNAAEAISQAAADLVHVWGARYFSQHRFSIPRSTVFPFGANRGRVSISCLFAAMAVQMTKRCTATMAMNDAAAASDADAKLRKNMAILLQLDDILPTAGWIHRRYARLLVREGQSNGGGDGGEARAEIPSQSSPRSIGHESLPCVPATVPSQPLMRPAATRAGHSARIPPSQLDPSSQMGPIAEEQQQQQPNNTATVATTSTTTTTTINTTTNTATNTTINTTINTTTNTTTTEGDPKDAVDDEWGDCSQLLNLEAALTDPGSQHPLLSSAAFDSPPQSPLKKPHFHSHRHSHPPRPQQQQREQLQGQAGETNGFELLLADAVRDGGGARYSNDTVQSETPDHPWFMDNISNTGNPFW